MSATQPMGRCSQHPGRRARWYCADCGKRQCPDCRQLPLRSFFPPRCGHCDSHLSALATESSVAPFWQRPGLFLAYPFHLGPAVTVLVLSALSVVGILPLLGWALFAGIWTLLLRQAVETLKDTAHGHLTPPDARLHEVNVGLVVKTSLLLAILPTALFLFRDELGPGWITLFSGLLVLLLPLMLMRLCIDESLLAALNPLGWLKPTMKLGEHYWALLLALAGLAVATVAVSIGLANTLPPQWLLPPLSLVQMSATLVGFRLIGYVLFQHHDTLGIAISDPVRDRLEAARL